MASLLKQLTQGQRSFPDSVRSLHHKHKHERSRPSFAELSTTLQSVARLYSRVFILIDALDECRVSYGSQTGFLAEVFKLRAWPRTNIFATSRFLLAQLHLKSLIGKRTPEAVRRAPAKITIGSDDYAYETAMKRIEKQASSDRKLAKQILSWIACAKGPLTTLELRHALAVEGGATEVDQDALPEIEHMVAPDLKDTVSGLLARGADYAVGEDEESLSNTHLSTTFSRRNSFSISQSSRTSSSGHRVQTRPNHSTIFSVSLTTSETQEEDDLESLASDQVDIASKASPGTTRMESNAIYLLAEYFARVEESLPLHKNTLSKMSDERVFQKRVNRTILAREIARIIQSDEMEHADTRLDRLKKSRVRKGNVNDWLAKLPHTGEPLEDLGTLREIINTVPKSSITLSSKNDISFLNKTKLYLESYTRYQWDWSPLRPPLRDVETGNQRVEWKNEVSEEVANLLSEILDLMDDHPPKCHCCSVRPSSIARAISLNHTIKLLKSAVINPKNLLQSATDAPSAAAQRYMSSNTPSNSGSSARARACLSLGNTDTREEGAPENSEGVQSGNAFAAFYGVSCLRVLFAVQGWRWSLELEQFLIPDGPCDSSFFRTLRAFHRMHRHALPHCFSPFRFLNCRFVKFKRMYANQVMSSSKHELPDYHGHLYHYEYEPRRPNIKPPFINQEIFQILLSKCHGICL
ncbi:hypothetical protein EDB81DRAFT_764414 [Dactylonectria macrodidyma]|uniref:NACHT domain-containing protein n=1 Tax=Dactylonectria macrodidyma TaxID=307937 RepID=A0A9P9E3H0_9HYPO|nr:hypothetical protein EDB81DRAFT_764414 [Dactylonectria macrodidyma]